MKSTFNSFRNKTLKQIRVWAWLAAVLPITGLAAIFFIWVYAPTSWFDTAIVVGETTMFAVAVIWWWWAIFIVNRLVRQWDVTRTNVSEVLTEIQDIRRLVSTPEDK
jgi:hypothetical protein